MYPAIIAQNWARMKPPVRPSSSEIEVFGKYISAIAERPNPKALVMGSTVELRSLCVKHGVSVTCVDYKEENYDAFSLQMSEDDGRNYICKDWRDLETEEKFDLILGDLSFNMLTGIPSKTSTMEDYRFTLEHMFQFLTPGGVMVQRIWVRHKGQPFRKINEIVRIYRTVFQDVHPYTYLFLPFAIHFYDYEKELFITSEMIKQIEILFGQGIVSEHEYLGFYYRSKDYTFPNSILDEEELYKLISEVLPGISIEKDYGRDCFAQLAPIYVFKEVK